MTWSKMNRGRRDSNAPSFTPARQGDGQRAPQAAPAPRRRREQASSPDVDAIEARAPDALIGLSLDPGTSMQALSEEAERNPALGQAYQRAAGRGSRSLSQAVLAIGLGQARALAYCQAVLAALPEVLPEEMQGALLEGCLRRAVIAERIAEEAGQPEVWPAFITAFSAELGLLYIAAARPHLIPALVSLSRHPGAERVSAERLMTGTDHGEAVAESPLGEALPDELRDVLCDHHSANAEQLGLIIAAADRVAELVDAPSPLERLPAAEQAIAIAGGRSDTRSLLSHANHQILSLAGALQLTVGRQPDPNLLLQPATHARLPAFSGDLLSLGSGTSPSGEVLLANMDNRACLREQVSRACEVGDPFAIITLNFDQFRRINDTFGVPAGDQIMRTLVEGLHGCLNSSSDRLARIGGDTFAIFMPRTGDKLGQVTAERIRSMVERQNIHLGGNTRVACSVTLYGTSFTRDQARGAGGGEVVLEALADGLERARQRSRNRTSWGG